MRKQYMKLVRLSALYDLIATSAFATPWTFAILHAALNTVSPLPDFEAIHVLIANLLGSVVIVWSILRLRRPEPIFGLYDSAARFLFLGWQLYYLLAMHGSPIVWVFAFFEGGLGVAQAYGYWLLQKVESKQQSKCRIVTALQAGSVA